MESDARLPQALLVFDRDGWGPASCFTLNDSRSLWACEPRVGKRERERESGARGSRPTIGERSLKASWKSFFVEKRPHGYLRAAIAFELPFIFIDIGYCPA